MLHTLHRSSAVIIALFALFHIANHAAAVAGVEAHIQLMDNLRQVYRLPLVEALLIGCVLFQVCSGLYFVIRRFGERHDFFDRLQAISGCYLAFFLLVHVSAVLFGRALLGLDTNFYYAAAGMHVFPYSPRPGTPAARMPAVDGRAIKARAARLRAAGAAAVTAHLAAQVGRDHDVLMESPDLGRTRQFAEVRFAAPQPEGRIVQARILGQDGRHLTA